MPLKNGNHIGLSRLLLRDCLSGATTVWLYREAREKAGKVEIFFKLFNGHLARLGNIAWGAQLRDASIVPVWRNHNTREDNVAVKGGDEPDG